LTCDEQLHGILRHTEGTKLRPDEEICVVAIVPPGRYLVQVENHDLISGPLLSFSLMGTCFTGNYYW
jgi:hypothetical protein